MWTLNGTRITVVDLKEENSAIISELQPLAGGTVYQFFGYVNPKFPLQCLVVGSGDKNIIESYANTGVAYPLVFDGTTLGNFYVNKVSAQWVTAYAQTFRTDKSRTDLIFKVTLDLSKE